MIDDEVVSVEEETSGIVALRVVVDFVVDVVVDVDEVNVVEVVVVEVVDVVVHFEQVHARAPSRTSLVTPNLQQDWV